jgi:hypothetical protein
LYQFLYNRVYHPYLKDFDRAKHRKHDACLVHIIAILRHNVWPTEFLLDYIELIYHLNIYAIIVTLTRQRPVVPQFEL